MKKLKKLLAGVITLAMAMSMMTMTAFAAPVFDGTSEGSLTIHKKAYEGTPGDPASGEDDATQVPEGAEGLNGVTFTVYQVIDAAGLADYYNTNPDDLPDVAAYLDENGAMKNESSYIEGQTKWMEVTKHVDGEAGVASFNGLPLGIYVVIETDSPALVTQKADPFMVAIPMTQASGDGWLYDVHVYPKNATNASGELTLVKKGKTIGVEGETTLKNVVFVLQVQGADGRWTDVEETADVSGEGDKLTLTTDGNGEIKVSSLPNGKYRFIEREIIVDTTTGENVGYIKDGATAYEFEVTSDGFITAEQTTPSDELTIEVVNEKPKFDKEIKTGDDTYGDIKDYNVGDIIDYKITIGVPSKIDKMKTFYVVDTPTNLDDKVDSIKVLKSDGTELSTGWNADKEGEHGFKITFDTSEMKDLAGQVITITYNAELLPGAETATDVANGNDAKLVYSHNILPDGDDDNPNKDDKEDLDESEDTSYATSYKLKVIKRAGSETGTPLEGVMFDLYKEDANGTITGDDAKALGLAADKTWKQVATDLTTDANGFITKGGLANGTYYLVETKTQAPYNLLKAPVEVTLAIDSITSTTHGTKWYTKSEYVDGVLVNITTTKEEYTVVHTGTNNADDNAQGIWDQTVVNKQGFTLPETGGMGTFVFTFVGIAMMAAAVILFITSKKKTVK